ncbi:hypothetical protein CRI87_12085 [Liquorilactobacillus satsumensis]|uniref:hypothetical protein n=1 Tax=Lactobacillaceae TaxID=33958 RepID=UPI001E2A5032|nr:hypothetical protein [Liquorilactobacillus satsumensis]MCC7667831.1 hypothetical protein [Liquorilactobacillus satsumensis]
MKNELEALASELPILTDKSSYKYLSEVAGNGKYIQVAWQKKNAEYLALYGTTPIQIRSLPTLNDIFEDEEG